MRKLLAFCFILFCINSVVAQNNIYKGKISDAKYKTSVAYASVILEKAPVGTSTNNVGEFSLSVPDSLLNSNLVIISEGFLIKRVSPDTLVADKMQIELQPDEFGQGITLSSKPKAFEKFLDKAVNTVIDDWIPLGNPETNMFDFGRIQTFPTYNPIEGVRLRAGIATNARLSPHFFMRGYIAYGFKDKKLKYRGEAIYSLNKKVYHENEFPKNNLRLVYENDIYSPGEMHPRAENDLLLLTYRRSINQATYRIFAEINYEREYKNGLAHTFWLRKSIFVPQGELPVDLISGDTFIPQSELNNSEVGVLFRYSLREAYVQQKRKRESIDIESPTFFLSHSVGLKDFWGGEYAYHRTEFSAQKRFKISSFGRLDFVGEYSKVWNAVPFPLLVYPNQRHKHHIENNAFFLNNALEFVADEQYTLRTIFVGDDLLLSKISILNKLKVKELVSIRASYGKLSAKNNPLLSTSNIYNFPSMSYQYDSMPYIEGTIGITNILGLLRVEYVHRFTYRNHLDALLGGARVDVTL